MTTQISNPSVVYPWPHLEALPECALAAKALWEMDIKALCFPGWAPAILGLATEQLAIRPGASIVFEQRGGSLRVHTSGGTPVSPCGVDYLPIPGINRTVRTCCEVCARPGAKSFEGGSSMVLCDVDIHLRRTAQVVRDVQVSEMSFSPRLPITEVAANALATLSTRSPALSVPAEGWSPAVLTAVTHLGGLGIIDGLTFAVVDDALQLNLATNVRDDRVDRIAESMTRQAAVTCRHCGRKLPDRSGTCSGCRRLQERGWHVEPGGDADATREEVLAFLQALPVGGVFTHATPGQQPDSWVKVAENNFRRTYGFRSFELWEFASWTHVELTEPVEGSIDQAEADRLAAEARHRPPRTEMGG